jgi:beta-glucosidase
MSGWLTICWQKALSPSPTLYHWDLPLELHHRGGWTNPDMPHWFGEYTAAVMGRLGDRVKNWTTLNEPHVFTLLGYQIGNHAPGHTSRVEYLKAIRNALLAHGTAAQIIHQAGPEFRVGIANAHLCLEPLTPADGLAANILDQFTNRIFLDPIIHGTVPMAVAEEMEKFGVRISSQDLQTIHQPLEFAGVNYYMRMLASITGNPQRPYLLQHPNYPGASITEVGWEVYPKGLEKVLDVYRNDYNNIPTYITENGAAYSDGPNAEGIIEDTRRIEYYRSHFEALQTARQKGCDVRGYFAWSLMDNFEWAHGYSQRFGLIFVDYANNCKRIFKNSALWYRDWINAFCMQR